jgi:hypothetical protein
VGVGFLGVGTNLGNGLHNFTDSAKETAAVAAEKAKETGVCGGGCFGWVVVVGGLMGGWWGEAQWGLAMAVRNETHLGLISPCLSFPDLN